MAKPKSLITTSADLSQLNRAACVVIESVYISQINLAQFLECQTYMPLFTIIGNKLTNVEQTNFLKEKDLQALVEKNLQTVFNCRFVATEFPTGSQHAGRIDTLALSEDNNPVIIEYKKVESSELINQSLYYLAWIHDHHGDFEIAARKTIGNNVEIDWSHVRVICIAPNYKKFDLYAVQVMGANIELWTYRFYKNQTLTFEEVLQKAFMSPSESDQNLKPLSELSAGKKAALTRATGTYTFEQHLERKSDAIKEIALAAQEFIMGLDPAIEEAPKKFYVAYKIAQNILCMELHRSFVYFYLKLNPQELKNLPVFARDVSDIGHFGTGDLELTISNMADFEASKSYMEMAYHKVGG